VIGSGPLGALLAGLLAHDHGKRVIRVAEPLSPQRLPRSIALALPFATRPATWRLLRESETEMLGLMASLGANDAIVAADVRIVTDLPDTAAALAHVSHLVRRLVREVSLAESTVRTVHPDTVELSFGKSGAAELMLNSEPLEIGEIVLADDGAILDRLPEPQRPAPLISVPMTGTLTAPAKRLAAQFMRYPDRGVMLSQRPDQSILALISGSSDLEARLASCLSGPFPLRRSATSRFRRLATSDGAPLIGRLKPSRLFIAAGLGDAGAFLAPPLARFLAGAPSPEEKSWFGAHDPSRSSREAIADFTSPFEAAA
jgi:glycine/D-amino acid oxidase-like deaminating enzyme